MFNNCNEKHSLFFEKSFQVSVKFDSQAAKERFQVFGSCQNNTPRNSITLMAKFTLEITPVELSNVLWEMD